MGTSSSSSRPRPWPPWLPPTDREDNSCPFPCSRRTARDGKVVGKDWLQADAAPTPLLPASSSHALAAERASSAIDVKNPTNPLGGGPNKKQISCVQNCLSRTYRGVCGNSLQWGVCWNGIQVDYTTSCGRRWTFFWVFLFAQVAGGMPNPGRTEIFFTDH